MTDTNNPSSTIDNTTIPQYFGDYEVLKTIGKGKFAVVYRAKKKGCEDVVALKRIAVDMMNEKAREKCLKEVRLLQSLDHPNIIRYMDSFIMENDLIIVYEWAAAGDLKRQLRKAQEREVGFEERVIWKYFSQISYAMQHMHEKRIMHRDLKPANIFLTLDGTIKVGDLGLSRELSEHTVQAHSKVGTPLYMSPEVLKGDGYDFKSDIWSLGCLLYELAMLKSPFKSEGLNLYSLFQKISNGDFQPLPNNYSEELRSLTYSMISTNPTERPEINKVCEIAKEMRTITTERSKQQRRAAAAQAVAAAAEQCNNDNDVIVKEENKEVASNDHKAIYDQQGKEKKRVMTPPFAAEFKNDERNMNGSGEVKNEFNEHRENVTREQRIMDDPATASTPPRNRLDKHIYSDKHFDYETAGNAERKPFPRDSKYDSKSYSENNKSMRGVAEMDDDRSGYNSVEGRTLQRMGSFQIELVDEGYVEGDELNNIDRAEEFVPLHRQRSNSNASSITRGNTDNMSLLTRGRSKDTLNSNDDDDDATVGIGIASGYGRPSSRKLDRDGKRHKHDYDEPDVNNGEENKGVDNSNVSSYNNRNRSMEQRESEKNMNWEQPQQQNVLYAPLPDSNVNGVTVQGSNAAAPSNVYRRPKSRQQNTNPGTGTMKGKSQRGGDSDFNPNKTNSKNFTEHFQNTSQAFALMEVLYNKLIVLDYPMEDPHVKAADAGRDYRSRGRLLPIHFACDLQIFPHVAGHQSGYQFLQFRRMVHVAIWLCTNKIKGEAVKIVKQIDIDEDTPVMMAKQILRTLPVSGIEISPELKDISPTSLTSGYGINVCHILNHLADAALKASHHINKPLVYVDDVMDDGDMEQQGDTNDSDEEIIEETIEPTNHKHNIQKKQLNASGDDEDGTLDAHVTDHSLMFSVSGNNFITHSIMMGHVDPIQWQQETERVIPKLLAQKKQMMLMGVTEWNEHIELLKKYDTSVQKTDQPLKTSAIEQLRPALLTEDLKSLSRYINEHLEAIRRSEKLMNANETCSLSSLHYSTIQKEYLIKQNQLEITSQAIEKLTLQLSEIQDKEEELHDILRLKTDGGEGGEGGGNSQIVRIKDAIHTLKVQIRTMSMDINLLNNTLLQERKRISQRKSNYRRSKKSLEDSMSLLDDI